jgi:hypothetical protein
MPRKPPPNPRRRAARKPPAPPPVAAPARMGQPPFVPTENQRKWVIGAAGIASHAFMAKRLGISKGTLRKNFRRELDDALPDMAIAVHANFFNIATGKDKAAAWAADRWLERRMPHMWRVQPVEIDAVVRASIVMAEPMSEEEWFREYGSNLASPGRTPTRTD